MRDVLRSDDAVPDDLRNAGNGSQRRFQLVGNIRRKLPAILFLRLFFRHIQGQDHRTHQIQRILLLAHRAGNDLIDSAVQFQVFLGMATLEGAVHHAAESLAPVHRQQIFGDAFRRHAEDAHSAPVIGQNLIVPVYHKQSLAHILRNHGKFLLLLADLFHLAANFPVLGSDTL